MLLVSSPLYSSLCALCPGKTSSPMVSIEQWYSRRPTAFETYTVMQALPSLFTNYIYYSPLGKGGGEIFHIRRGLTQIFSIRPRQKTKDRVVTAQGAPCCHLGRVKLQIRIREFQKTWEFHILNNMQYQCILGIDFMKESKLTLDFDQKSLIIPDNQIKQLQKMEKPIEINLSDTKLGEGQKQKLRNLFYGFKGLFSDQQG
ncbi:uncharacterized protein TNCV_1961791 [Trichonephila clavipes]|nr:uncharacterized protein TNCV_1961791 [Trichonephila clavipes]